MVTRRTANFSYELLPQFVWRKYDRIVFVHSVFSSFGRNRNPSIRAYFVRPPGKPLKGTKCKQPIEQNYTDGCES